MTTSAQQYDDILYVPVAKRLDFIPQSVSDHYPIALEWRLRKQTKRHNSKLSNSGQENQSQEKMIKRPLPEWLFQDERFTKHVATIIDNWNKHRMTGNNGLIEFTELVYKEGESYLKTHQVEAVTLHHRLEITIAVLAHLESHTERTKIPIDM